VATQAYSETKSIVDGAAFSRTGPIFFVDLGEQLIFHLSMLRQVIPYNAMLTLDIFLCQVLSATLAARYTIILRWEQSLMTGSGISDRAVLAFVVIDIAYVQDQYKMLSHSSRCESPCSF